MSKRLTTDEFIKKVKSVHGDKYDYSLVDYKRTNIKVKIICKIHGVFEQTPEKHLFGRGCPICNGGVKSTEKEFINKAKKIHGDKYNYSLVKYINSKTKVKIICKEHGVFEQLPGNHLQGYICYKCVGKGKTKEDFVKESIKTHGKKYDYTNSDYINNTVKILIKCDIHGEFLQSPEKHIGGNGCPICKESFGEKKIRIFLENNNIDFIREKKFDDCRNILPLPFDFYLTDYNMCIEYDGRQHYNKNCFMGDIDGFKKIKTNDNIKTQYCKDNNINLIRIPYTEYENVENILKNEIK